MSKIESPPDYQARHAAFIDSLRTILRDRGHLAELRRYWSPRTRHYAYPILGRIGAISDPERPDPRTLVAALYAVHSREETSPDQKDGPSVGTAFLRLGGGSTQSEGFESTERHFRRLLACQTLEELGRQLHRLVKRLERERITLDYTRLLEDLSLFRSGYSESVKTRWSRHFWQAPDEPQPEEA